MANSKITFCDYLAEQVPNASYEVLQDSGLDFPRPRNKRELSAMLKKYVAVDRELALKSLARIHPDRELLEGLDRDVKDADFKIKEAANKYGMNGYMNMNGVLNNGNQGTCTCHGKSNFNGETQKDYTPLLVTIGLFGLLYLIIDKKS